MGGNQMGGGAQYSGTWQGSNHRLTLFLCWKLGVEDGADKQMLVEEQFYSHLWQEHDPFLFLEGMMF